MQKKRCERTERWESARRSSGRHCVILVLSSFSGELMSTMFQASAGTSMVSPEFSSFSPSEERWHVWSPHKAADSANVALVEAVRSFQSTDTEAGKAATLWLRERSLEAHPSVVTRLLVSDGIVQGFYTLASSQVRLTQRQRRGLTDSAVVNAVQPASFIEWMAKHRDAEAGVVDAILLHAAYTAIQVTQLQGNVALVVDPIDEETAALWQDRYGFRRSLSDDPNELKRLWIPLGLALDRPLE